jgi:hypothetical protein
LENSFLSGEKTAVLIFCLVKTCFFINFQEAFKFLLYVTLPVAAAGVYANPDAMKKLSEFSLKTAKFYFLTVIVSFFSFLKNSFTL